MFELVEGFLGVLVEVWVSEFGGVEVFGVVLVNPVGENFVVLGVDDEGGGDFLELGGGEGEPEAEAGWAASVVHTLAEVHVVDFVEGVGAGEEVLVDVVFDGG